MWEARPAAMLLMFLMFSMYRLSALKGEQQLSPLRIFSRINSRLFLCRLVLSCDTRTLVYQDVMHLRYPM